MLHTDSHNMNKAVRTHGMLTAYGGILAWQMISYKCNNTSLCIPLNWLRTAPNSLFPSVSATPRILAIVSPAHAVAVLRCTRTPWSTHITLHNRMTSNSPAHCYLHECFPWGLPASALHPHTHLLPLKQSTSVAQSVAYLRWACQISQ